MYSLEQNGSRYSVTVIDHTDAERIHAARTWIYIEVTDEKGESTMWALEGASVIQVERRGWTKDMIKVGSTIGVRCHQLRDNSSGCLLGFITLEGAAEKMFD